MKLRTSFNIYIKIEVATYQREWKIINLTFDLFLCFHIDLMKVLVKYTEKLPSKHYVFSQMGPCIEIVSPCKKGKQYLTILIMIDQNLNIITNVGYL